jgi:hypothetical protein
VLLLLAIGAPRWVDDDERRHVGVHPDIAGEVADVAAEVGEVAQRRPRLLLLVVPARFCTRRVVTLVNSLSGSTMMHLLTGLRFFLKQNAKKNKLTID